MNKKFYTLVAALLLSGAFATVNAQTHATAEDIDDAKVFYLSQDNGTKYYKGVFGAAISSEVSSSEKTLLNDEYFQWQLVEVGISGGNATAQYKLKNVVTGQYFKATDGNTIFTANDLSDNTGFDAIKIDTQSLNAALVNNKDAYKNGFSLQFEDGSDHKTAYTFIDNVFVGKTIKAYDAKLLKNGLNGVLLKVEGDWNGGALYTTEKRIKADGVTVYSQDNYNADEVKKFRASKFIILGNDRYSQFATDVNGDEAKGYKYEIVTGAEFLGKTYEEADADNTASKHLAVEFISSTVGNDWTRTAATTTDGLKFIQAQELTSSITRVYTNAVFTIERKGTDALSCVNDLILSVKDAYIYSEKDGKAVYENVATAADDSKLTVKTPLVVTVFDFEGQKYVCSAKEASVQTHPAFVNDALVGVTVDPKTFLATKRIFNVVYYANGKNTSNVKGMTWNPSSETNADVAILAKFVDNSAPEGQWIVTYDKNNNTFTFTNLENPERKVSDVTLYDNGSNKYTAVASDGTEHYITLTDAVKPDTQFGYVDMTDSQLENGFNISFVTDLLGNVYLRENHESNHKVTFVKEADKDQAAVWRMVKFTEGKDYAANIEATDTIQVINDYTQYDATKNDFVTKKDSIEALAYAIYNDYTKEYLKYDATQKAYYTDPASDGYSAAKLRTTDVQKFVLKKKTVNGKSGVNLLPATIVNTATSGKSEWKNEKLIGSSSENKLTQDVPMYRVVDNDLFAVTPVSAPIYRTLSPVLDTVKIFKDENNSEVLYEKKHFLAMEHVADVPGMQAAMYVDTAYVRDNAVKPQYLLVVGAKHVVDEEICDIPGHPAHRADTVFGRFLVNMVDSMNIVDAKTPHSNPYKWETYPKLAFIAGTHTHDVLSLPSLDKTFDLSKNADNVATFQFRYVDRESGSFLLETQTKVNGNATTGWVKWLNGTPVVVDKIELAEVLNLQKVSELPTANEGVNAEAGVSVVAVDGAIIVKNAAGKKVAISNILGKAIANTTIASDYETIAAPAGIAVVAVEGEEAVKVVVK